MTNHDLIETVAARLPNRSAASSWARPVHNLPPSQRHGQAQQGPIGMAVQSEIMRILGRLEEGQERMTADIEASSASRGRLHEKIDKLEETIGIAGQVAAQARNETAELRKLVYEDVKPVTEDFRRVQSFGRITLWAVGAAAALLGITLATTAETVINAIRNWLRIQ